MRKYAFDLVFDAGGATVRQDRDARRFTQEELDAARAQGLAAGRADAQAAAEAALAAGLEAAALRAAQLGAALQSETALLRQEAAKLAFAMASKVAGRALELYGAERALEAFDAALERLGEESRIVVRVAPEAVDRLRGRLAEAASAHGFSGTLVVRAGSGATGPGDVSLEWADGAVGIDHEALLARLEDALAQNEWGLAPPGG